MFPKIGGKPPNHPLKNRVLNHYFHHPFWGFSPYFWKHPHGVVLFFLLVLERPGELPEGNSQPSQRSGSWIQAVEGSSLEAYGHPLGLGW